MANKVKVNSGPRDTIILKMMEKTKPLTAMGVGRVITTAAVTNKNAQSRPDKCGPVSGTKGFQKNV